LTLRRLPARSFLLLRKGTASLVQAAGTREAAQVAFFLVMSFPATLLLLVWLFSGLFDDASVRQTIVDSIIQVLPLDDESGRRQVEGLLDDVAAGAGSLGWLGAVSLLYSASGAIGALRFAICRAWGEADTRPYARGKALDAGLTLIAAPLVIAGLGLSISGSLADAIGDRPWTLAVAQFSVTRLIPLALLLAVLTILFRVLPGRGASTRAAVLGALVALAGMLLVQAGTDVYLAAFGPTRAVYGTLGLLLGIVFSAYLDAIAVILGAHVAAEASRLPSGASIDRVIEQERAGGPSAGRLVRDAVRGLFTKGPSQR
jgi:membrane protein